MDANILAIINISNKELILRVIGSDLTCISQENLDKGNRNFTQITDELGRAFDP